MTLRPCPSCLALNPTETRICAACGGRLKVDTIILSGDGEQPYTVETHDRALPAPNLEMVGRAVALTAVTVAAEVSARYLERRFLRGRPVGSRPLRQMRRGALAALSTAAVHYAASSAAFQAAVDATGAQWRADGPAR